MEKESKQQLGMKRTGYLHTCFPEKLIAALAAVAFETGAEVYFVGGTVRDWLLGRVPHDLDLAVNVGAEFFCRQLISELNGGTYVQLGTAVEEAARAVWNGFDVDISSFRGGAKTIEEDLALRDFTINSIAVNFVSDQNGCTTTRLIDPLNGVEDLQATTIRHCPGAFANDPLRLLRAYRFVATLGFSICRDTVVEIKRHCCELKKVAAERIYYEFDLVMQADISAEILWQMHQVGLLIEIVPELYRGLGVEQPDFHHLDVFHHNFQTLREMEQLLRNPEKVYSGCAEELLEYTRQKEKRVCLKWAALLHDIGKPTAKIEATAQGRVTFYGHDEIGKAQFDDFSRRQKWSNEDRERTGSLIGMHMHPFHLCNVKREKGLSKRAALKICKRAGDDLPGLFLLAMSDSLASRGDLKPAAMEKELVDLYCEITTILREHIQPVLSGSPLVGGHDLIEACGLTPGPLFSRILDEIQSLQVEGQLTTREEALAWVMKFTERNDLVSDGK